jgi:hypothetical protein
MIRNGQKTNRHVALVLRGVICSVRQLLEKPAAPRQRGFDVVR